MTDDLVKHLRAYQQADQDGIMVLVSRQACDEAADRIEELEAALDKVKREARNEALREAAQKAEFTSVDCSAPLAQSREKAFSVACNEVARRILALMEDKNDE